MLYINPTSNYGIIINVSEKGNVAIKCYNTMAIRYDHLLKGKQLPIINDDDQTDDTESLISDVIIKEQ